MSHELVSMLLLSLQKWINVTPTDVPDIDEFTIGDSAPEPSYDIS
jgi:hypothetical protein